MRIVRTPTVGQLTGIITCPDIVGCATHFYQRRTVPCETPNCDVCAAGIGWRWHGWVSCILASTQEHVLFEMTAEGSEYLRRYRDTNISLRGCLFCASRVAPRPNARVTIKTKPADLAKITLPQPPDLMRALAHIWGIPPEQANIDGTQKTSPKIGVNRKLPIAQPEE
jgi:hypothetical protein